MGFTALALIVLCLKLFCCKRVQGEALGASDPSDSAEGVQMTNKHTRNSIDITSIEEEDPEKAVVHRSTAHQDTILEG